MNRCGATQLASPTLHITNVEVRLMDPEEEQLYYSDDQLKGNSLNINFNNFDLTEIVNAGDPNELVDLLYNMDYNFQNQYPRMVVLVTAVVSSLNDLSDQLDVERKEKLLEIIRLTHERGIDFLSSLEPDD